MRWSIEELLCGWKDRLREPKKFTGIRKCIKDTFIWIGTGRWRPSWWNTEDAFLTDLKQRLEYFRKNKLTNGCSYSYLVSADLHKEETDNIVGAMLYMIERIQNDAVTQMKDRCMLFDLLKKFSTILYD